MRNPTILPLRPFSKSSPKPSEKRRPTSLYCQRKLKQAIRTFEFGTGYESYPVKYLEETPLEDIDEDWVPSLEVHVFMKRAEMDRNLRNVWQKNPPEPGVPLSESSEQEIWESARDAVMEMWRVGIRKYVQRTMITKYKVDFGMGFDPLKGDAI